MLQIGLRINKVKGVHDMEYVMLNNRSQFTGVRSWALFYFFAFFVTILHDFLLLFLGTYGGLVKNRVFEYYVFDFHPIVLSFILSLLFFKFCLKRFSWIKIYIAIVATAVICKMIWELTFAVWLFLMLGGALML